MDYQIHPYGAYRHYAYKDSGLLRERKPMWFNKSLVWTHESHNIDEILWDDKESLLAALKATEKPPPARARLHARMY